MFTGIVEEIGTVRQAGARLGVLAAKVVDDSHAGSSIAVNGVCLTVTELRGGAMWFDLSPETVARSALGRLEPGDPVNLERPVTLMSRLEGHLVQGHADGVGEIASVDPSPAGAMMTVTLPGELSPFVVEKGSIAIDGVSLTVAGSTGESFGVALVPFTLAATTLGRAKVGDPVNLEVDVVAKYVESFLRRSR